MSVYNLSYCTPDKIPSEVLNYDSTLEQMGVGKSGKLGILQLKLENDPIIHKTTIKYQHYKVPLCIKRAMYLEETCPEMAYIYIISPSGGILQGDRFRMDISLSNSAKSHVTTQSATRIYKMNKNFGTQIINLNVDKDCYLEYIPDQIIPFRDSRFYQVSNIKVHDEATCIYSEILTPGRVASNESFEYDICYMKVKSVNQYDKLRLIDIAKIEPKRENVKSFGILNNYDVLGSVYILTPKDKLNNIQSEILESLSKTKSVIGGCTKLPNENGVLVRMLGSFVEDIRNLIYSIVGILRRNVLNISFSGMRKI
ncbi:urease accessory protein UreD [Candidatus Nitrosocosmicus franklandus]|uniref:Urease accessory protein UreD n=1 Tax=Candidatus Nitrosocosmicus franklandianus TaxID=1798806 RepID=A0A484ICN9_9ARCH|nr:urease accessory protein UreD [Candidatus Nitrosocosmicus franklandus]VFJ13805.1 Urease accessory protein UreD [Candidatus Nitrosocosmicus franklandus]